MATPVTDVGQAVAESEVSLRQDAPLVYVVKKGDTLWAISGHFLDNPWQWPELWYANGQIKNPHLIYPGDRLRLVWVNGKPRLTDEDFGRIERMSPQIRATAEEQPIPAIPIDALRDFLQHPRVLTSEQLEKAPYILEFTEGHIAIGQNDGFFARGLPKNAQTDWEVAQPGSRFIDPDNGKLLGYEAIPVGQARLLEQGETSKLVLDTSEREARIGDRLLPLDQDNFDASFFPHPPTRPVAGRIISVFDGLIDIPIYSVVVLNRGSKAGLDPGTVLTILQAGRSAKDPYGDSRKALPDQAAGDLMVFKTTPELSYALVMRADRPTRVLDRFEQPSAAKHRP